MHHSSVSHLISSHITLVSRNRLGAIVAQVVLAVGVGIELGTAVQRRPLGLVLEKAHSLDILPRRKHHQYHPKKHKRTKKSQRQKEKKKITYILLISRKPMIDTRWEDDQIILLERNAHPLVLFSSNIKVSRSIDNVSDLLVFVQMLVEERLDFVFVHLAHRLGGDGDLVAVLVAPLAGELVNVLDGGASSVEDTDGG